MFFSTDNLTLDKEIKKHLNKEQSILVEYFLYKLKGMCINHPHDNMLSKIEVLDRCNQFDIKYPDTIITSSKCSLLKFYNKHEKVISKNITQGVFIFEQNFNYQMTQIVIKVHITDEIVNWDENISDFFFSTNITQFLDARTFNLGLNKKICINSNGDVKNYFNHNFIFGNIKSQSIAEIISTDIFQQKGNIGNDEIAYCRNCKYRYCCVSNSDIFYKEGIWFKKNYCSYINEIGKK